MSWYCKNCDKYWQQNVETCIFCGSPTEKIEGKAFTVISKTAVRIPSKGNESVPYFVYLIEDEFGQKQNLKLMQEYNIGDTISLDDDSSSKRKIGVIGSGQMGSQIAEYLIDIGYPVILKTRSEASIDKVKAKIAKRFSKKYNEDEIAKKFVNLYVTIDYADLAECELLIEASTEDIDIKKEVFSELSKVCSKTAVFATNSSSLSIDELADITDRPDKVIGCHFFNPVPRMDLIEVVVGKKTSDETREGMLAFATEIYKKPVLIQNSPGFVVNRLLLPQINDAVRLYEAGIATKEGIDSAVKMGLNHPMGPFALADFIGLDVCVAILNVLYTESGDEHFKPAPYLQNLVNEGKLGFKSGEGFYKYR